MTLGSITSRGVPPLTTADTLSSTSSAPLRKHHWSLRRVRWLEVVKYQHWGGLLLFVPAVVIVAVSHFTFQQRPVVRQALMYDATISYHTKEQTIPNSLAVVFNWILMVLAAIVIELLLLRKQQSLTAAITGLIHQLWCCAINFVIVIAVVEVTKPFSGRLRPDFLARCQPSGAGPNETLGPVHLGQLAGPCTNQDWETIKDGRLSFPSGHASNSMSLAMFTSIYVIWSMYLRHDAPYPGRLRAYEQQHVGILRHIGTRLIQELWHALVYAFVLLALCLSWFIGITRFWDNVHNISDILGGFLVAVIFTTPFAVKAIGLHTCIRQIIDDSSSSPVLPVAAVHDGGDGVVVNNGATATAPAAAAAKRGGHHHHELGHGGRGNDSHMVNLPPAGTSAV